MLPSCDVLIAGCGPAGLSAAITAASEGMSVTMIDPGTIGGQARWSTAIENVPGFPRGITGRDYADRTLKQARKFGAKLITDRVETFCPMRDGTIAVQLESARMIECAHLILAIGLHSRPLPIPLPKFGVFTGANPEDIDRYSGKRIAIVGAGNSAGQAANAFVRHHAIVTLYASHTMRDTMSAYLTSRLNGSITVREHARVESITRDPNDDTLIINSDPDRYAAVFSFVGGTPQHAFPVATDPDRYITTDHLCTSIKRVYAIGDVRAHSTKRIAAAVGDGASVINRIHQEMR